MRNLVISVMIAGGALALVGCAVPRASTMHYAPAQFPNRIVNEAVVPESFDVCWSRLIAGLSSEFFVINNVEKASGLITLDFASEAPERYIDCGQTTRTYADSTFTYAVAGDSQYLVDEKVGVNVARKEIHRTTSVEGKINVHVSAVPDGTKIAVNVRYVLTTRVGGRYRIAGSLASGPVQEFAPETYTKAFNTNAPSERESQDDVSCGSNGALEQIILDVVRKKP